MFRHVFHCPQGRCVALAAGTVFSFTAHRGERIACRGGRVLLTQFGIEDDFDLRPGETIDVRTHGLVVIEAIDASVLLLESVGGQKYLQQTIQVALAARRRAHVFGRHFQQFFALRRQ
jgi:hypothetical protein